MHIFLFNIALIFPFYLGNRRPAFMSTLEYHSMSETLSGLFLRVVGFGKPLFPHAISDNQNLIPSPLHQPLPDSKARLVLQTPVPLPCPCNLIKGFSTKHIPTIIIDIPPFFHHIFGQGALFVSPLTRFCTKRTLPSYPSKDIKSRMFVGVISMLIICVRVMRANFSLMLPKTSSVLPRTQPE